MIPIIETEVTEKHQWMKKEELLDLIAIAQSCPGVFAINISTFIGYKLYKRKGAACAALATALPSFFIILIIAMFFQQFEDNKVVAAIFRGIRPASTSPRARRSTFPTAGFPLWVPWPSGPWGYHPSSSSWWPDWVVMSMVNMFNPQNKSRLP